MGSEQNIFGIREAISTIVFALIIIIYDDAKAGILLSLSVLIIILFFEVHAKEKKVQDTVNYFRKPMYLFLIANVILDCISTILGVHIFKVGNETNTFLIWLWSTFGVFLGYSFYISIITILLLCVYKLTKAKNPHIRLSFVILGTFWAMVVNLAVLNNFHILYVNWNF